MANPSGYLAKLASDSDRVTGETVFQAAEAGDADARELFEQVGFWCGVGTASLVTILDPELVVVTGGLTRAGDLLLVPMQVSFERYVFVCAKRRLPPILVSLLGVNAGLIGAGLLALHEVPD